MPKRVFESNESTPQLPLAKKAKIENEQSQTELVDLPNEILAKIAEYLPPENIGDLRQVSKKLKGLIDSKHGPRLKGFNDDYLNLFPNYKENTTLTYPDYLEILDKDKESFLEKQFAEIKIIQKNLAKCPAWSNLPLELKEEILKIDRKSTNYMEAKRIEDLLDSAHLKMIEPRIDLQSTSLRLCYLNLTRFPKALFTDDRLQAFWQALEKLYLNNNQLTILPAEIGDLQALTNLFLYNNLLTLLPLNIVRLQALRELSLYNNQLEIIPPEIGGLQALRELYLHNNQLILLPAEISELKALRVLTLNNNLLERIPPKIGGLQALRELYLSNNRLEIIPPEIGDLQELRALSFNNNRLEIIPQEIGGLQVLRELYLSDNQLKILPDKIGGLQALKVLILFNNKLTSLPVEISQLQDLEELSLDGNHLNSETLEQFELRFGSNFVNDTLATQTYPNIVQAEDLSNRNSPRP